MWRRFIFKITIRAIRKYFSDGLSVITDNEENIIAYQWAWSKNLEDEVF